MKTKIFTQLALVPLIALGCAGIKGSGNVVKQDRQVLEFHTVEIGNAFEVHLRMGETPGLTIITDDNLQYNVITEVKDGVLTIAVDENMRSNELKAYITMTKVEALKFSGACEVTSANTLQGDDLELELSGASEAELVLNFKKVSAKLSGASEAKVRGTCRKLKVNASGASDWNSENADSDEVEIDASGASEATVVVRESLEVEASGASNVRYIGTPKDVKQNSSGASSVQQK